MIFMKELGGVAIADKRKLSSPFTVAAFNFLDQLWAAKAFFAFEVGGVTRMYDAKHLSAARSKFDQSCAEIRTNWDDFVGRQ
jgi:hypothetical protein